MSTVASLSLDQAPPYHIPLRFFITAPMMALVAGLVLMTAGPAVFASRWTPELLAITHLLTLGYISMVMLGALLQMLPVLAGAPVSRVVMLGSLVHLALTCGCLLLAGGFIWQNRYLLMLAAGLLSTAALLFSIGIGRALYRAERNTSTISGMRLSLLGLVSAFALGLLLTAGVGGWLVLPQLKLLTDVHLGWGMAGWFGVLLIAVSYQVVPMFQVTGEYPAWMRSWLLPMLVLVLTSWSVVVLAGHSGWQADVLLLSVLGMLCIYAVVTLQLFANRKRKVPDNTVLFWRVGMVVCLLVVLLLLGHALWPQLQLQVILGVLMVQGVMLTMINGMLYRIVPFLSWFHLQHAQVAEGRFDIKLPHMKSFVSDRAVRRQFYLHLASLLCMLMSVLGLDVMSYPAAFLFFLSNLLLLFNLGLTWRKYSAIREQLMPVTG